MKMWSLTQPENVWEHNSLIGKQNIYSAGLGFMNNRMSSFFFGILLNIFITLNFKSHHKQVDLKNTFMNINGLMSQL